VVIPRGIVLGALVEEVGRFAEGIEPVGKPGRDPKLARFLRSKRLANPLAERRGRATQIDSHIEDLSRYHTDQLALGMLELVMKSPQSAPQRVAMIVLHEASGNTEGGQPVFTPTLEKIPSRVAMDGWLQNENVLDCSGAGLHRGDCSSISWRKYRP
jgi:hypothetical protein